MSQLTDEYQILTVLGRGKFGITYLARRKSDGIFVAIKLLDRDKVHYRTVDRELSLYREVSSYPHCQRYLICTYDTFEHKIYEDKLYAGIVMEFLTRTNLADLLVKKIFTEAEMRRILTDVLMGLHEMHQKLIVHMDVKLANIIYNDKEAKLIDFGSSCHVRFNGTGCDNFGGTPNYSAPEFLIPYGDYLSGLKTIKNFTKIFERLDAFKFDAYSAGIVGKYLIDGEVSNIVIKLPDKGYEMKDFALLTTFDRPDISNKFKNIVRGLMNFDPDNRLSVEEALLRLDI